MTAVEDMRLQEFHRLTSGSDPDGTIKLLARIAQNADVGDGDGTMLLRRFADDTVELQRSYSTFVRRYQTMIDNVNDRKCTSEVVVNACERTRGSIYHFIKQALDASRTLSAFSDTMTAVMRDMHRKSAKGPNPSER